METNGLYDHCIQDHCRIAWRQLLIWHAVAVAMRKVSFPWIAKSIVSPALQRLPMGKTRRSNLHILLAP